MVFASHTFLFLFLPIFLAIYYCVPFKLKNLVALLASYFFYAWGAPLVVVVLLVSCIVDHYISMLLSPPDSNEADNFSPPATAPEAKFGLTRKQWLTIGLLINLALLFYYKYTNFFLHEVNRILNVLGVVNISWTSVALPAGISFFTFHKISYLVDIYRGTAKPARKLTDFLLYVVSFPQLIAGPIVRYHDVAPQIIKRQHTLDNLFYGAVRFSIGLGKKVLIADQMGYIADNVFAISPEKLTCPFAWIGIICYAYQIYFDFSGYSDMALGLGRMMGFHYLENFNMPYISQSITDFWRRWHISLSNFLREYLYFPLGGNRVSSFRSYLNLWIVFLVSGIWHGASWTFVFWGLYHGLFLTLDKLFMLRISKHIPKVINVMLTFVVVNVGWVFFRSTELSDALSFLAVMFNPTLTTNPLADYTQIEIIHNRGIVVMIIASVLCFAPVHARFEKLGREFEEPSMEIGSITTRYALGMGCYILALLALSSSKFTPFLYFNF